MKAQEPNPEQLRVACEVCLKEIPHEDSHVSEIDDYVLNFCGLECYELWQKDKSAVSSNSNS